VAGKKTVWDLLLQIGGKDAGVSKAFKNVQNQIKETQRATKQFGSDMKAFASSAAKLALGAAGAFTAITAGVLKGVDDVAMRGEHIAKFAREVGIGAEAYQELSYAMRQSGLSAEDFDAALLKYNLTVKQGAAGNKAAAEQLAKVGLSAEKLSKLTPEKALERLSDYFKSLPSDAERTRVAVSLFGKTAGPKMLLAMKDGSAGLQLLRDEARKTGNVIEQAALDQAEAYAATKLRMKETFEGAKTQFFIGSIEAVTKAFGLMGDETALLMPRIRELGDRFGQWLGDMVQRLPGIIKQVKEFAATVRENVDRVVEMAGGWENVAKILAALIVAPTAIKGLRVIFSLARVIQTALAVLPGLFTAIGATGAGGLGAVVAAAAPVIAVIAGIAAVIYVIATRWDYFKAKGIEAFEKIKSAVQPIFDTITKYWEQHGATVMKVLDNLASFLTSVIGFAIDYVVALITNGITVAIGVFNTMKGVVSLIFDFMVTTVKFFVALFTGDFSGASEIVMGFISRLGGHFDEIFAGIGEVIGGFVQFWKDIFQAAYSLIFDTLTMLGESWGETWNNARDTFVKIVDAIKAAIQGILDKVKSVIGAVPGIWDSAFSKVKEIVSSAIDFIMGPINKVKDAIAGIVGSNKQMAASVAQYSGVNIPVTASGGIFKRPQVRMIAEAGGEGVIPYTRPEGYGLWAEVGKLGGYFSKLKGGEGGQPGEPGLPGMPGRPFEVPDIITGGGMTRGGDTINFSGAPVNINLNGRADDGTISRIREAVRQGQQEFADWLESREQQQRRVSFT